MQPIERAQHGLPGQIEEAEPAARWYLDAMEVTGIVKDGRIVLLSAVKLPEGAHVRVILEATSVGDGPYEREPVSEESVAADLAWATGKRFGP